MPEKKWIVYEESQKGHRKEYALFFSRLLDCAFIFGRGIKGYVRLLRSPHALFSSCDDYLVFFTFLAAIRSVSGKKTLAIATRPESVFKTDSLKLSIKKSLYSCIKRLPRVKVLSILPFYCEPRLKDLVDEWIYDPQFWDLKVMGYTPNKSCVPEISPFPSGTKMNIILPGKLSRRKGAEFMMDIYLNSAEVREKYDFILAGENQDISPEKIDLFREKGGYYLDRCPTEKELLSFYDISHMIWCCYPEYFNHSSGIFGRALQLRKRVIIRKGSYLDRMSIPDLMKRAVEYGNTGSAIYDILSFGPSGNEVFEELSSLNKFKKIVQEL